MPESHLDRHEHESTLRVVHISTYDIRGGASLSTYQLHRGMVDAGLDSKLYVLYKGSDDPTVLEAARSSNPWVRILRHYRRWWIRRDFRRYSKTRPAGLEIFSDDRSPWDSSVWRSLPESDVMLFHWTSNFVDFGRALKVLSPLIPITWRLPDMNLLTGGCHFDWGCGRFRHECGRCPQLGSKDEQDLSHAIWYRKKVALAGRRIDIVCPNNWMVSKVKESSLFGDAAVTVIPNGVDCDTFRPGNKERARASMGLPIDVKIVMFSAANCNNIRKGMRDLLTAVNDLEGCELFLLIVGQGDVSKRIRVRHEQFGYVSDLSKLANLYRAADVFVIPSLEDNMPNTCLEAMASGTPVVGYAAGGIPEMVEDGVHGFLAPPGDAAALSRSIRVMLSEPGLRNNMAIECRKIAVERFSRALQVREYAAWLTKIKQR